MLLWWTKTGSKKKRKKKKKNRGRQGTFILFCPPPSAHSERRRVVPYFYPLHKRATYPTTTSHLFFRAPPKKENPHPNRQLACPFGRRNLRRLAAATSPRPDNGSSTTSGPPCGESPGQEHQANQKTRLTCRPLSPRVAQILGSHYVMSQKFHLHAQHAQPPARTIHKRRANVSLRRSGGSGISIHS